jgi:hypothetical protein
MKKGGFPVSPVTSTTEFSSLKNSQKRRRRKQNRKKEHEQRMEKESV